MCCHPEKKAEGTALCLNKGLSASTSAAIAAKQKQYNDDPAVVAIATSIVASTSVIAAQTQQNDDPQDIAAGIISAGEAPSVIAAIVASTAVVVASTSASVVSTSSAISSS